MKRMINALYAVLISVLLVLTGLTPMAAEGEDFDAFLKDEWIKTTERGYIDFHFTVKDYQSLGLTKPEPTFGGFGYEENEKKKQEAQESLDLLHSFDYNSLTEEQQYDYTAYEFHLENTVNEASFPNYDEMFNPYRGTQSNLMTMLTEFTFYAREDIDDYLTLIRDYPRASDDMIAFTKQQAEQGYFMTDTALDVAVEQMQSFADKGEENPLIVIFEKNIDAFEGLTDEERTSYKETNRDIVLNEFLPAVQKSVDFLKTMYGSRSIGETSLCNYPDGEAYLEGLLRRKTSDNKSASEVESILSSGCKDAVSYLTDVMMAKMVSPGTFETTEQTNESTTVSTMMQEQMPDLKTPEEMLEYLRNHMEGFPRCPDVNYVASYLDPSVANPSVSAYYLRPPVDDLVNNVIRVNGSNVKDDALTQMYYTLAHEGFPGHLYNFTWFFNTDYSYIRHDLALTGYTEGWAQYVERIMLLRSPLSELGAEVNALNIFYGYSLQAACDVAVNGYHYDKEQLKDYLRNLTGGDLSDESVEGIYSSCVNTPYQILPYGYGQTRMWELRERVQKTLGDDFDLEDYHYQVLNHGPRPFYILEEDLEKYTESKGKELKSGVKLFEASKLESVDQGAGDVVNFISRHIGLILIIGGIVLIGILVGLFFLIRGFFRLIFGKKNRE